MFSVDLSKMAGRPIWLKLESDQRSGSFKFRGAMNKALCAKERGTLSLVTGSTGNHGLALVEASMTVGMSSTVYLAANAPKWKCDRLRAVGADVRVIGDADPAQAEAAARQSCIGVPGTEYVSPYNDLEIIGGHATLAVELVSELGSQNLTVFCATGGGGLASGLAVGFRTVRRDDCRVVSVAPFGSNVLANSVARGYVEVEPIAPTLSESTAGNIDIDSITVPLCKELIFNYHAVNEEEVGTSLQILRREVGATVEGAAAVALAGALNCSNSRPNFETFVVLVCGGNSQ